MKYLTLLAISLLSATYMQAQTKELEKKHSLKFPFGIGYAFEQPVGNKTTINYQVDIGGAFSSGSSGTSWVIAPVFKIEPRHYYNFLKRQKKGKSVRNNSASYISLVGSFQPGLGIGSGLEVEPAIFLIPNWGFRVPIGQNFSFNGALGYGLAKFKESEVQGTANLYINFEYNF